MCVLGLVVLCYVIRWMADSYGLALDGLPSSASTLRAIPSCTMLLAHYTLKSTRHTRPSDT